MIRETTRNDAAHARGLRVAEFLGLERNILAVEVVLYTVDARLPLVVAGAIGISGVLVFAATVEERYAG